MEDRVLTPENTINRIVFLNPLETDVVYLRDELGNLIDAQLVSYIPSKSPLYVTDKDTSGVFLSDSRIIV